LCTVGKGKKLSWQLAAEFRAITIRTNIWHRLICAYRGEKNIG